MLFVVHIISILTDRSVVEEHLFYDVYLNNGHLDNFGNNTTYRTQYEYGLQASYK